MLFFRPRLGLLLNKSQLFRKFDLPYLTKCCLKCYLGWVWSFGIVNKQYLALFSKICVSKRANLSLVLLIKVLLIKKACNLSQSLSIYPKISRIIWQPPNSLKISLILSKFPNSSNSSWILRNSYKLIQTPPKLPKKAKKSLEPFLRSGADWLTINYHGPYFIGPYLTAV